jgi:4-nitrophenyl phosphatase
MGSLDIAFLIDLDGTMYAGNTVIPEARRFIAALRTHRIPYLYVTNNSSRTPEAVAAHLSSLGIPAEAREVVTSSQATAKYLTEQGRGRRVYAIGEEGLKTALSEAGMELVEEHPDYVVQGLDREFSYRKLDLAVRHILSGAEYVVTNADRLLPTDGRFAPGAGSISGAIRAAVGIDPVVIGKPSARIMHFALERLKTKGEVWAVGDNPATDIGAGQAAGLKTALILSGVATKENADQMIQQAGVSPDRICANLLELLDELGIKAEV